MIPGETLTVPGDHFFESNEGLAFDREWACGKTRGPLDAAAADAP